MHDRERSGGLAEDGHLRRVSSDRRNVPADPLQRSDLVEQPVIPRRAMWRFFRQLGVREESQRTDAIVDADDNDSLFRELGAVVDRDGARTLVEAAAVNPE